MSEIPRMCGLCHKPVEESQPRCYPCKSPRPEEGWPKDRWIGKTILGNLTLVRRLGWGTSGTIYLGQDPDGHKVAVKLLYPELTQDERFVKRFKVEAAITKTLDIPQVVRTYDFGVLDDGTYYLTMEYVDGYSLDKLLMAWGRLSVENAIEVTRQILSALDITHKLRIVHRDLKPGNLMITRDESGNPLVKILDFGFAKVLAGQRQGLMRPMRLTTGFIILGTPQYMSPEQAEGRRDIDGRADLYSVGAILYKMLTGVPPFDAKKPIEIIQMHLNQPPNPPSLHRPEIPLELDKICLKLLEKDRTARYQSAQEVLYDLEKVFGPGRFQNQSIQLLKAPLEPSLMADQVGRYIEDFNDIPKRKSRSINLWLVFLAIFAGAGLGALIASWCLMR